MANQKSLTNEQEMKVLEMLEEGVSQRKIAETMGVSRKVVIRLSKDPKDPKDPPRVLKPEYQQKFDEVVEKWWVHLPREIQAKLHKNFRTSTQLAKQVLDQIQEVKKEVEGKQERDATEHWAVRQLRLENEEYDRRLAQLNARPWCVVRG